MLCCRSTDDLLAEFPCTVNINSCHNHRINSAAALSFRDPHPTIREKFIALFKAGHSATQAVEAHKRDLMDEHQEDYSTVCADRSVCPDVKWAQNLYRSAFEAEYGPSAGDGMMRHLQKTVLEYSNSDNKASIICTENDVVIAVCSALMQRIHTLPNAAQICFLDSSGNLDRYNCRVFLLMVDTAVGGLPIGVLITTSESEAIVTRALEEYKKLLPEGSFGGNGEKGPVVFMTDNAMALRNSLGTTFAESTCLLCIFHVLQAAWRWLWDSKHGISMADRQECFACLSKMLYCLTEEECVDTFINSLESDVLQKYENFHKYLSDLYDDRQSWALYRRQQLPTRGNNTNNTIESAFRVLKDKVFDRTRAYSVPQLFHYVTDCVDSYYSSRILTAITGRSHRSRYQHSASKSTDHFEISAGVDGLYTVFNPSSGNTYTVHVAIGICSCPVGLTGGPCKHQHAVSKKYNLEGRNDIPLTAETKMNFHWVATGSRDLPADWYSSLEYKSPRKAACEHRTTAQSVSETAVITSVTSVGAYQ